MKKTGHSNQNNRGGSGRRKPQQGRPGRTQSQPNGNRGRSNNRNAQATKMWLDSPSQTLTSHIPMLSNAKRDTKKGEGRNGNGPRSKGQNKFDNERKGRNPDRGARRTHSRNPNGQAPSTSKQAPSKTPGSGKRVANIEPFELFCAYHLGIDRDKQYKSANINEVGRRFNADPATIRQALKEYGMDSGSLLDRDFDMALAQLDIQVAPEGVDRIELAKNLYEEFQEAPIIKRDWKKILEEDRRENQKIFRD